MEEHGVNRVFPEEAMGAFAEYLEHRYELNERDTIDEHLRNASRILHFTRRYLRHVPSAPVYSDLLDAEAVQAFFNALGSTGAKAKTKIKYVNALTIALDYLSEANRGNRGITDDVDDIRKRRVPGWKAQMRRTLQAEQRKRRKAFRDFDRTFVKTTMGDLANNETLRRKFNMYVDELRRNSKLQFAFMTSYASMHVLLPNAQRASAITGMTIGEYLGMEQHGNGRWIISVENHKTGRSGAALLVINDQGKDVLDAYWSRRAERTTEVSNDDPFFITTLSNRYTKVNAGLRSMWTKAGFEEDKCPTVTQFRKSISTKASQTCDDAQLRCMAQHMAHSLEVHRDWYADHTEEDAAQAWNLTADWIDY